MIGIQEGVAKLANENPGLLEDRPGRATVRGRPLWDTFLRMVGGIQPIPVPDFQGIVLKMLAKFPGHSRVPKAQRLRESMARFGHCSAESFAQEGQS